MGSSKRPVPVQRAGWQAQFHSAIIDWLFRNGGLVREGSGGYGNYSGWRDYSGTPGHGWTHDCPEARCRLQCAESEQTCPEGCGATQQAAPRSVEEHLAGDCAIDFERSSYEDSEWTDFAGTFADDPWPRYHGIDAIVWCRCGQVQGRRWRFTEGHATLLRGITGTPEK
jgi:hypothetical protein